LSEHHFVVEARHEGRDEEAARGRQLDRANTLSPRP